MKLPKVLQRKTKHAAKAHKYGGATSRKLQNTECGRKIGRGQFASECTRPRGHTGGHYATHPSIKRDVAMRRGMKR